MKIDRQWWVAVFPAAGAIALVLGYIGYRELPDASMTRADALLSSIQLFVLGGSTYGPGTPWPLNVARYLAPLALAYATALAVAAIFWEQLQYLWVGLSARGHTLVAGYGAGVALPKAAARSRRARAVVMVPDSHHDRVGLTRSAGATVVTGDPTDQRALRRLRAHEARHVVVATGSDLKNLEVLACLKHLDERPGAGPVVHVEVEDEVLWTELGRLALDAAGDAPVVEFFNRHDRAALKLVNTAERFVPSSAGRFHIDGSGPLARRLLVHVARRADMAGSSVRVCIGDPRTPDPLEALVQEHPWITEAVSVELCASEHATDVAAGSLAFVCLPGSDAAGIGRALKLASNGAFEAVLVSVSNHDVQDVLSTAIEGRRVVPVAAELLLDADFLSNSAREVIARARHEDYVLQETLKGSTPDQNPSLVPWAELPDSLKDSNRSFADSVGRVIGNLGGHLVPLRALGGDSDVFADADLVERLAQAEHDRWAGDLRRDGWRYDAGPKNPTQRTHPLLVPWEELSEEDRQKDRDAVLAIPQMLARVGYGFVVPPAG